MSWPVDTGPAFVNVTKLVLYEEDWIDATGNGAGMLRVQDEASPSPVEKEYFHSPGLT
jgi:hypothetical protein